MATIEEKKEMAERGFIHEPEALAIADAAGANQYSKGGAGVQKWFKSHGVIGVSIPNGGDAGHVSRYYDKKTLDAFAARLRAGEVKTEKVKAVADDETWITITTAATILGRSRTGVYDLRRMGRIRSQETGARIGRNKVMRVLRADVMREADKSHHGKAGAGPTATWSDVDRFLTLEKKVDFIAQELGIVFPAGK